MVPPKKSLSETNLKEEKRRTAKENRETSYELIGLRYGKRGGKSGGSSGKLT
jgi:hypothetical protein